MEIFQQVLTRQKYFTKPSLLEMHLCLSCLRTLHVALIDILIRIFILLIIPPDTPTKVSGRLPICFWRSKTKTNIRLFFFNFTHC